MAELNLTIHQAFNQLRIIHTTGNINLLLVRTLTQRSNTLVSNFYFAKLILVHHLNEGAVGKLVYLRTKESRHDVCVNDHDKQNGHNVVVN